MTDRILHIKNMVCDRCIRVVREELTAQGYGLDSVELGKVVLEEKPGEGDIEIIRNVLSDNGFELIDDKRSLIINRIRTLIIEFVHRDKEMTGHQNFSDFLAREIGHEYSYLSNLFSSVEGITIEKYLIRQKVEKVKELLVYDQLSLAEIAYRLDYSSVQHLSNQFKKVTGLTPTHFRKIKDVKRKPLDKV